MLGILCLATLSLHAQTASDSVTISGHVTDFEGNAIDSCSIVWNFGQGPQTLTDGNGFYSMRLKKGKYIAMYAIYLPSYCHTATANHWPEEKKRLEYWAWNVIADRDTTIDIRYDRVEVYGLHAFHVTGSVSTYQLWFRPMVMSRTVTDMMKTPKEKISNGNYKEHSLLPIIGEPNVEDWSPDPENLDVKVWVESESVPVLMKRKVDEYIDADQIMKAYMVTVPYGKKQNNLPYIVFKVQLTDLETGEHGEGIYYMEK